MFYPNVKITTFLNIRLAIIQIQENTVIKSNLMPPSSILHSLLKIDPKKSAPKLCLMVYMAALILGHEQSHYCVCNSVEF